MVAAVLDGVDGRVARLLKGTSRFGAELDSLADFVNFGVAPALILYSFVLHELRPLGWIVALDLRHRDGACGSPASTSCSTIPNRPEWKKNFFVGMPAPAGALTALLPLYLQFLGLPIGRRRARRWRSVYVLVIALPDGDHDPDLFRQDDGQARAA